MSKMHIWFVATTYDVGGAEIFSLDLLKALRDKKIKVDAFTNQHRFYQKLKTKKISTQLLPETADFLGDYKGLIKAIYFAPREIYTYWHLLKSYKKPDVVILIGFSSKLFFTPLAKFYKVPVVWFEFGPYGKTIERFFKLPKLLYHLVKKLPAVVIVPTEHTKRVMVNKLRISPGRLKVVACGRASSSNLLPQRKSRSSKEQVLICPSRFEVGKGQDILVKAFALILREKPNVRLVFTGDHRTKFGQKVKKMVKVLGLKAKVEFKGWVKSVLTEIKKSDICVFPSVWPLEGFGLVQIEAMAQTKPVVAFDRGPTNEIVINGETGLLVKSIGDHKQLADHVLMLLKNKRLATKLGQAGRKRFLKHYQMSHLIDDFLNVFRRAKVR